MSAIKLPVREDPTNKYRIVDADGVYVISSNYPDRRDELIRILNGYGVAVGTLRDILTVAKGIDRDSREMLYVGKLAVDFTHSTLKQLGELNGDDGNTNRALRDDNSISPEKHRCARKGIGETPGGDGDTCEETREDDGGESGCAERRPCVYPDCLTYLVGGDGDLCLEHDTMRQDTQEAADGKR